MYKIYHFFSCLALCLPFFAVGQNPCGTFEESKWLDYYFENKQSFANGDSNWLYVPVTMHIVGNDAGAGYFQKHQVFKALCNMNEQYVPVKMRFYLHPTEPFIYHNNSTWYEHDWDGGDDLINTNGLPGRLNAYLVGDPAGNCGYSWQSAIVLSKGCSGATNSTWAHEVGHHFSLPHTFLGWEGRDWDWATPAPNSFGQRAVEKVDRSNCATAGDRFCDTYPDYISNRWNCNNAGSSYQMLDPDSVAFQADGSLFMSYANDECQDRFSDEQIAAMRASLQSEYSNYLITDQEGPAITEAVALASPASEAIVQYNEFMLDWEPVANADYYIVEISLLPNFPFTFLIRTVEETQLLVNTTLPNDRTLYWRVRPFSRWSFCDSNVAPEVRKINTTNLVATNTLEQKTIVTLAPNPAISGEPVLVHIEASFAFDAALLLYDVNGRQMGQKKVHLYEGENTLSFDTYGFAAGIYRAVLQNEQGTVHRVFSIVD